jgi:hypothetical protein
VVVVLPENKIRASQKNDRRISIRQSMSIHYPEKRRVAASKRTDTVDAFSSGSAYKCPASLNQVLFQWDRDLRQGGEWPPRKKPARPHIIPGCHFVAAHNVHKFNSKRLPT